MDLTRREWKKMASIRVYDYMKEEMEEARDLLKDMGGLAKTLGMPFVSKKCQQSSTHCEEMAYRIYNARSQEQLDDEAAAQEEK
jgi:hypothetical protein